MGDEQNKNLEARIQAIENEQNELEGRLDGIERRLESVEEKADLIADLGERLNITEGEIQAGKFGI